LLRRLQGSETVICMIDLWVDFLYILLPNTL
jgi:hypothetical protein